MKAKKRKTDSKTSNGIASPESVLAAAKKAPRVFHIGAYFHAIRLMREKGHAWRFISDWLKQFNIEVSYVHLRRLYVQEHNRVTALTDEQRREEGWDEEAIQAMRNERETRDPTGRLLASDPDPEIEPKGKESDE